MHGYRTEKLRISELRKFTRSILVPEFAPKKSRPVYVDNSLLNFMPYVQLIVKQMKCTLTRRRISRIIFYVAKKLVLKSMFQVSIYYSKCRNSLPSHPLYSVSEKYCTFFKNFYFFGPLM
jgi:hypothetical protein